MKRFRAIIFVCGESAVEKSALSRAAALAELNDASLTVARTVEEQPRDARPFATAPLPREFEESIIAQHRAELDELVEPLLRAGRPVTTKILLGKPFISAIQEVYRGGHDLLAIPVKGKTGWGTRLFGSTVLHLIRKCPCPVWAMRPKRRPVRVLAAVNPSAGGTEDRQADDLNLKIVEIAASYASLAGGELHLVHAWDMVGERTLRSGTRISAKRLRQWARQARAFHRRQLDDLIARAPIGDREFEIHFRKGKAEAVISTLADRERVDVIVLGTTSRSTVTGLLIGNTAEEVLNRAGCSVLAIKPDGFVSPVAPTLAPDDGPAAPR